MVSQYSVIMMNVIGILEVLLPLLILYLLHRFKGYKFSSVICGLACYFIINYVVINNVFTVIRVAVDDDLFFSEHTLLGLLIESFLSAILMCPLMYLFIKKIRGGKWSIYDAAAMAIAFWMVPVIMDGGMQISTASILSHARKGTLDKLATEDYPVDLIQALADSFNGISDWHLTYERLVSILIQLSVMLMIVSLALILFYAVKRNKKHWLYIAMALHFLIVTIVNGSSYYIGYWPSFLLILAIGLASLYFIIRFFRYFRSQQAELLRRKKEFKEEQHRKYQEELAAKKNKQNNNTAP